MARPGKRKMRKLMKTTGGNVSAMAEAANVTRTTVYNWLEYYDMRDDLDQARANIVMMAEDNIYEAVLDGDINVSRFVLQTKGRMRGWNQNVEVSGVLGSLDLTPEQMQVLEQSGMDVGEVVGHFVAMMMAGQDGNESDG